MATRSCGSQCNLVSKPNVHSVGINCKPTINVKAVQVIPNRVSSGQQTIIRHFSTSCQTTVCGIRSHSVGVQTDGIDLQHSCFDKVLYTLRTIPDLFALKYEVKIII